MHGVGKVNIQTDLKINQLNKIKKRGSVSSFFLAPYKIETKKTSSFLVIMSSIIVLKEQFMYY